MSALSSVVLVRWFESDAAALSFGGAMAAAGLFVALHTDDLGRTAVVVLEAARS